MDIKYLMILLFWISEVKGQKKCCEGTINAIEGKRCTDGLNITGITCEKMYMIEEPESGFTIYSDGSLLDDEAEATIDLNQYCLTLELPSNISLALVCFPDLQTESESVYLFRASCAVISVIFLILTSIVYILVPSLRDLQGKCILNSIITLALAMFLLCILQFRVTLPETWCFAIGYIIFVSFLATFTWMNMLSFHIWRTTIKASTLGTDGQWFIIYCAYAYGVPAVIVLAAIIGHHVPGDHIKPNIGVYSCWFANRDATWAYFYGPIAFILAVNLIFFIWTIKKLWKDVREAEYNTPRMKASRFRCLLYVKLFFIMGLSWIFEVLSFAFDDEKSFMHYVWLMTDFINALQGVLIFLILVVFRKKALRGLAKRGLFGIHLPDQWKTLQDEECDELVEERYLTRDTLPEEHLYKEKESQSFE